MARPEEEQEIDLLELAGKIWAERRLVLKWCGIAVIVALVVAFSIPKEYTTTVMLAPEVEGGSRSLGGLSALAGMAGINVGAGETSDALYPDLYPDIVSSVNFTTELFDVPVQDADGELNTNLYTYLMEEQRSPWWSAIISFPFKCLGWITSLFKDEEEATGAGVDPFQLTKDEDGVVKALNERIARAGGAGRRFLEAVLEGGKSGVSIGLSIIPGVLIICTFVMMFTNGPSADGTFTGAAYEGIALLPAMADKISFILNPLFGFTSSEAIAVPITALGSAGAAVGVIPELVSEGLVSGNDIAVFTAMCMCWSGYLSTHVAMMDSLGFRKLTGHAILCHTIGGLCAGISAHIIYSLI